MSNSLVKNTLLSQPYLEQLRSQPAPADQHTPIVSLMKDFEGLRNFASEIHTERQLIKPMLKVLGYAVEPKPKFFEEQIKAPDFALFKSDADRVRSAPMWGTKRYYDHSLAILLAKRYGRNLQEGVGGFFLAFENRIPLYQALYLTKKCGTPWSLLTNGKSWILLRKPFAYEIRVIEMDIEKAVAEEDEESLRLFYRIFSAGGLEVTLPAFMEKERKELAGFLKDRRASLAGSISPENTKADAYGTLGQLYTEFFPGGNLPLTQTYRQQVGAKTVNRSTRRSLPINPFDQAEVFSYLATDGVGSTPPNLEPIIMECIKGELTKENLLALRILDLTPGFGTMAIQLVEAVAHLSFLLLYRERNSFVAEWEHERLLYRSILSNVLFGIERSHFALDVLQNALLCRFNAACPNYRLGNPLLSMSIKELHDLTDAKMMSGLFSKHPSDTISGFREIHRLCSTLSNRIKEDAAVRSELETQLQVQRRRIQEIMDLFVASHFDKSVEGKKAKELLFYIEGDEAIWEATRKLKWFITAREIAARKNFFHMEMEFPVLLNNQFDLVVIQPGLHYLWEENVPVNEVMKAHVKRALSYLKEGGKIVMVTDRSEKLAADLHKSRKYEVTASEGAVSIKRQ